MAGKKRARLVNRTVEGLRTEMNLKNPRPRNEKRSESRRHKGVRQRQCHRREGLL
ncbi:hypothetical protein EVA_08460 [gut metagenome]|uniref:Uncharacterized protein n=1 Tax=gut metagenome TaxID=749906 RepID=J9G998_9ZZZZ